MLSDYEEHRKLTNEAGSAFMASFVTSAVGVGIAVTTPLPIGGESALLGASVFIPTIMFGIMSDEFKPAAAKVGGALTAVAITAFSAREQIIPVVKKVAPFLGM